MWSHKQRFLAEKCGLRVGTVSAAAISWAHISADNKESEEAKEVSVSSSESRPGRVTVQSAIKAILCNLFSSASELVTLMREE